MKQYLRNLLAAARGKNPYQEDMDVLRYQVAEAERHVQSLQILVENLRERIRDKERMVNEYRQFFRRGQNNYEQD